MMFMTGRSLSILMLTFVAVTSSASNGGDGALSSTPSEQGDECPRSNETHVVWTVKESRTSLKAGQETLMTSRRHLSEQENMIQEQPAEGDIPITMCEIATRAEAEAEALTFLQRNIMDFDRPLMETMGFPSMDSVSADGLDGGLIGPTIKLALDTKIKYAGTDVLPHDIFYDYVLNYAFANEPRTNWRPLLTKAVEEIMASARADHEASNVDAFSDSPSPSPIVKLLNTHLWTKLSPPGHCIKFVSSQTPAIFDPMSILAYGYASCTGLAVLFVSALRAAGVACRVVGTPAWHGNRDEGNHNWVEIYTPENDGDWIFMEPSPNSTDPDTMERDPCKRWFCGRSQFPGDTNTSQVFAAKLNKAESDVHYPLAWEWGLTDVPGVNRTDYYLEICGGCDH